ncbi:MAG: wax ester/triacylglycerol synthase family O-acyltransferase, partial [Bacteroidota bacterium]
MSFFEKMTSVRRFPISQFLISIKSLPVIGKILEQFNNKNIEAISGMDATFLYGETPTQHMHVGSVSVIEGSLKFETFKKIIHSRMHLIPKLRKRLVMVPFEIDYPYWVDDPNFDIDMHIHRIALPAPGGWKELREVASRLFSLPLDRNRPLWQFTFVEGLNSIPQVPKGSVAAISKVHHVAIDGMAGAGMLALIFDMTKEVKEIPAPKPWKPAPIPNELAMMFKSSLSFVKRPLKMPKLIAEAATATIKSGMLTRAQRIELPTAPFTAPSTPLNGIISSRRKWNTAILSLDRVKALKKIMDTTLNDVVLSICAGALRRYLNEKGKLPNKPLVAMVPISTRAADDKSATGNQISSMLIQLATNVADPIERLEVIHENTQRGKSYQNAIGAKTLSNMAEAVPFGIANQAARIYSRYNMAKLHKPAMNLTITNVPGPQFPLYLNGHQLISIMGMAPIIDGMGLIITVLSYNGLLTLSPTSDAKSMPDIDIFTRYLRESANEMEAAILKMQEKGQKKKAPKPVRPKSDKFFEHIKNFIKENPDAIYPDSGIYQFHITGPATSDWKLDLNKSPGVVRRGKGGNADVTLTIKDDHLMKIAIGKLNVQTAFIQGRLKLDGDMAKAMRLGKILSMVPDLGK